MPANFREHRRKMRRRRSLMRVVLAFAPRVLGGTPTLLAGRVGQWEDGTLFKIKFNGTYNKVWMLGWEKPREEHNSAFGPALDPRNASSDRL